MLQYDSPKNDTSNHKHKPPTLMNQEVSHQSCISYNWDPDFQPMLDIKTGHFATNTLK